MAIVIPRNHSSAAPCKCGNWFQYWKNCSGQSIFFCPVLHCLEKDLEGTRVIKMVNGIEKAFVIPLCSRHAKSDNKLHITDAYMLVPADDALNRNENQHLIQKFDYKAKISLV